MTWAVLAMVVELKEIALSNPVSTGDWLAEPISFPLTSV